MDIVSDLQILSEKADAAINYFKSSSLEEERLHKWFDILYDKADLVLKGKETDNLPVTNVIEFIYGAQRKQNCEKKRASSFLKRDHLHERRSSKRIANTKLLKEMKEKAEEKAKEMEEKTEEKVEETEEKTEEKDDIQLTPISKDKDPVVQGVSVFNGTFVCAKSVFDSGATSNDDDMMSPQNSKENWKEKMCVTKVIKSRVYSTPSSDSFQKQAITKSSKSKLVNVTSPKKNSTLKNLSIPKGNRMERTDKPSSLAKTQKVTVVDPKKLKIKENKKKPELRIQQNQEQRLKIEQEKEKTRGRLRAKETEKSSLAKKILEAKKLNCTMSPEETSFVSYDISEINSDSEDEDDSKHKLKKRVPIWASGISLQSSIVSQLYHPVDTDHLFGNDFGEIDLSEIMGVEKMTYKKRTSSAIWNTFD